MNPADVDTGEEQLDSLRTAYDEALAAGESHDAALPDSAPPALQARWRRSRALLDLLEWDRRGAEASTLPRFDASLTPPLPGLPVPTSVRTLRFPTSMALILLLYVSATYSTPSANATPSGCCNSTSRPVPS